MDTINDTGGNRYFLFGFNFQSWICILYVCDICFYTWILVDRKMSNEDVIFTNSRQPQVFDAYPMFFLKLSFSAPLCSHFSRREKKTWAGKILRCEAENGKKIEEAYRFDGWGAAEKETAKSSINRIERVLKKITQRPNYPSQIYSDEVSRPK